MNLKNKVIAFGLTGSLCAMQNTLLEMRNIILAGGKLIPIMPIDTYRLEKYKNLINEIELISKRRVISTIDKSRKIEVDALVIAPCSRQYHFETCIFYI